MSRCQSMKLESTRTRHYTKHFSTIFVGLFRETRQSTRSIIVTSNYYFSSSLSHTHTHTLSSVSFFLSLSFSLSSAVQELTDRGDRRRPTSVRNRAPFQLFHFYRVSRDNIALKNSLYFAFFLPSFSFFVNRS